LYFSTDASAANTIRPAAKNSTSGATLGIQMRIGHYLLATKLFNGAFKKLAAAVANMGGLEADLAHFQLPVPTTARSWSYVV
jgi:hypothetical protein